MRTIHAKIVGDNAILHKKDLERLVELARLQEEIDFLPEENDIPTHLLMRVAEESGSFEFWNEQGEDVYTIDDGAPV